MTKTNTTFEATQKTDCDNLLDSDYTIGQEVKFKDGKTAKVVQILHSGHPDIRSPFHQKGCLVLSSNDFLGRVKVIPNEWPVIYGDEINENKLV